MHLQQSRGYQDEKNALFNRITFVLIFFYSSILNWPLIQYFLYDLFLTEECLEDDSEGENIKDDEGKMFMGPAFPRLNVNSHTDAIR